MKTFKKIAVIILFVFVGFAITYLTGFKRGYEAAKAEIKAKIIVDKQTLIDYEKERKDIVSEPDSLAIVRFKKYFGTE